jgi:hypothetical protein
MSMTIFKSRENRPMTAGDQPACWPVANETARQFHPNERVDDRDRAQVIAGSEPESNDGAEISLRPLSGQRP